jgi:hypothetical protein
VRRCSGGKRKREKKNEAARGFGYLERRIRLKSTTPPDRLVTQIPA